MIIGAFVLFAIIAGATKMAVKEALLEFKEEMLEEFNLKRFIVDDNKDSNIEDGINKEINEGIIKGTKEEREYEETNSNNDIM